MRKKVFIATDLPNMQNGVNPNQRPDTEDERQILPRVTLVKYGGPVRVRRAEFARWYGCGIDEITRACQQQIERFVAKQDLELEPMTIGTYFERLKTFLDYCVLLASAMKMELTPADINRTLLDGYIVSLNDGRTSALTQRGKYVGVKVVLKALCARGLVHEVLAGDDATFPANPFPGAHKHAKGEKPLKPSGLYKRFQAVEAIHELSQYSDDPMIRAPWPDTSADRLSGYGRSKRDSGTQTPLMPDDVFERLYQRAWATIQGAERLLDLRDHLNDMTIEALSEGMVLNRKNKALASLGWEHGLKGLRTALLELRTACYVVIASLSGCRNHEMSFVRAGAYYSTVGDEGERYWWMRSKSTKTGVGDTEWMIPEAAALALKTMDRWAAPYQVMLQAEIAAAREQNPRATRIAEAQEHVGAVFVGVDMKQERQVRTLGTRQWNALLKDFARDCHLDWPLATHHFRRKFANYAARSQFGDLRYLKEHFKHWSLDMTLHYALNEAQELTLFLEIEDELEGIKERVSATWLAPDEPLAGGYGNRLVNWRSRSEAITLFKSHAHMVRSIAQSTAIRSNGHAFCTADDNLCVGNDVEPTRCAAGCDNAVISRGHATIYQRMYDDLVGLTHLSDIGEGGRARVRRDLERCRRVLADLGFTPPTEPT